MISIHEILGTFNRWYGQFRSHSRLEPPSSTISENSVICLENEAEGDAPEVGGDDEAFFPAEEGGERRLAEGCWGVQ